MQVENPEDISTGVSKVTKIIFSLIIFIVIAISSIYFIGPQNIANYFREKATQKEVHSSEVIQEAEVVKNEDVKAEKNPEEDVVYKDDICNDLPSHRRTPIWFEKNPDIKLNTFIACSDKDKQDGLIGVFNLAEDDAMLFVFENPDFYKFWMKDTSIYLAVAFINENNEIIEIFEPEPLSEDRFGPETQKSKYVLETTKGWFERNNLKPGDKIVITK